MYTNTTKHAQHQKRILVDGGISLKVYLPHVDESTVRVTENEFNTLNITWRERDDNEEYVKRIPIEKKYDLSKFTTSLNSGVLHINITKHAKSKKQYI